MFHNFGCVDDGCNPYSGVIFDNAGNLYGTTLDGGADSLGTVYELSPSASGWTAHCVRSWPGNWEVTP